MQLGVVAEVADDPTQLVALVAAGTHDQDVLGRPAECGDGAGVDEPTAVDDDRPIADRFQLGQQVGRHDDALAVAGDLSDQPTDVLHAHRVEAVGRLVEDDQLRVADQCGSDPEPLLHPERVAAVAVSTASAEAHEIDQAVDAIRVVTAEDRQ